MNDVTPELRSLRTGLQQLLDRLDRIIEGLQPTPNDDSIMVLGLPRTKAIEWALDQHSGPLRPIEIWKRLQDLGRNDPKSEISVTAYDLAERGRIRRVGHGLYQASQRDSTGGPDADG